MALDHIENYTTKNPIAAACEQDWCIAPFPGTVQQVSLQLNNNKSYAYACRYPATEGCSAIVGCSMAYQICSETTVEATTGSFGKVTEALPKLTIKRSEAVEVDFLFNPNPAKKDLTNCIKYLNFTPDDYGKTLQFQKECYPIRPITYFVRRILAAASILAHPELAGNAAVEQAKNELHTPKGLDKKMEKLNWGPPENIGVDLSDIHIPNLNAAAEFDQLASLCEDPDLWYDGKLNAMSACLPQVISTKAYSEHVNKYAHLGAISIMVRGGFKNLLVAYLSADPSGKEYLDEAINMLKGIGFDELYAILKDYVAASN